MPLIKLIRKDNCPGCAAIEEMLLELCLAHNVVTIRDGETRPEFIPPGTALPALIDGEKIISGEQNILSHLKELAAFKEEWDRFQSDSCYCGDDGEVE